MKSTYKIAGFIVWIIVLGWLFVRSANMSFQAYVERAPKIKNPPFSDIDPALIKIFTFGYKGVYDDFVHLWMVQNLVDDASIEADPEGMLTAIHTAVRVAPKIEGFYMLACFTLVKNLQRPGDCEEVIKAGLKKFPNSFRLPMTQGFVSLFELNDRKKAAAYYAMAAGTDKAPPYVEKLVERMLSQEEMTEHDLQKVLEEIAADVQDENWQHILKTKYLELQQRKGIHP